MTFSSYLWISKLLRPTLFSIGKGQKEVYNNSEKVIVDSMKEKERKGTTYDIFIVFVNFAAPRLQLCFIGKWQKEVYNNSEKKLWNFMKEEKRKGATYDL